MAQEHILKGHALGDENLGETDRDRWSKTEANFNENYASIAALEAHDAVSPSIVNTTAVALSVADLNTAYPDATTAIGFSVVCTVIGLVYTKTGAATWIATPIVDVAGLNQTIAGTTLVTETYKKLVSLTSANLLGMNATPVVIIAAPGEGKAIRLKSCVAICDSTATAYANGGVIYLSYNNTTPITNNVAATFLTGGDKVYGLNPLAAAGGVNMLVNTAVAITNDTAPFITGTGVVRLLVEYDIVTTGL